MNTAAVTRQLLLSVSRSLSLSVALPLSLLVGSTASQATSAPATPLAANTIAATAATTNNTLLLDNIRGYRVDAGGRYQFNALLIENGKVSAYDNDARQRASTLASPRLDGNGNTLLPGLIDAHGHVQGLGQEKRQIDMRGVGSLSAAQQQVNAWAKAHPELPWLLGRGWNQVLWDGGQFPTARDLDAVVSDRPILLERIDGHASWANSRAMKAAGISKATPDPAGGQIIRDARGEPTGIFVDNAMNLLTAKLPAVSEAERLAQYRAALAELAALGMTGVHDAGISPDDYRLYQQLGASNELPLRVYAMLADSPAARTLISKAPPAPQFEHRLFLRSVKAWVDGALGSRGAAMLSDYSDHPNHRGLLLYTPADMQTLAALGVSNGWQLSIHAIGDAGNRIVLDTLDKVVRTDAERALRHRIEHAQVIALGDIPRFAKQQVIASIQPTHATSDMNMAEARVGSDRIKGAYAWRKLLNAGARLAGGSDFPVELANPFYGLHAAVTRTDRDGQPPGGWYPAEKLSRDEALRIFTHDAAYAGHMEQLTGSLAVGQYADFILVDRDFFTVPEQDIAHTKILSTWVAGKKIFSATP